MRNDLIVLGKLKTPYPPNQGLKRINLALNNATNGVLKPLIHQTKDWNPPIVIGSFRDTTLKTPYPPNQGLKHRENDFLSIQKLLKTPYPPNQGLKLRRQSDPLPHSTLKTPYPPNQGLKLIAPPNWIPNLICLKPLIHQTKDWNMPLYI